MYGILNIELDAKNTNGHELYYKAIVVIVGIIADLSINTFVTVSYITGLHSIAKEQYGQRHQEMKLRYGQKATDDRVHELIIEATRYTVLFIWVWILSFIAFICFITVCIVGTSQLDMAVDHIGDKFENFRFIMIFIGVYLKEIALLIAIRLSWKFSHEQYMKRCDSGCHSCINQCCKDLVNDGIEKQISLTQLKQPLL